MVTFYIRQMKLLLFIWIKKRTLLMWMCSQLHWESEGQQGSTRLSTKLWKQQSGEANNIYYGRAAASFQFRKKTKQQHFIPNSYSFVDPASSAKKISEIPSITSSEDGIRVWIINLVTNADDPYLTRVTLVRLLPNCPSQFIRVARRKASHREGNAANTLAHSLINFFLSGHYLNRS